MKFTVEVGELRSALQIVNMSLPAKSPLPIAECVLIEAADGIVTLTCTDLVMQVSRSVHGDDLKEGRCAVRGKMFEEVIKKMPDGALQIEVDKKGERMVIRSGKIKSQMACMDPDTFPVKESFEPTNTVKIASSCLLEMIVDTEACIARADMREVLTGGCIDVDGGVVRMVALDGYRMGVKGYLCSNETSMKAIIPMKSLMVLKKILAIEGDEIANLEFGANDFRLVFNDVSICCSLINGEYVQWRKIVPPSFTTTVTVPAEQLRSSVERAYIIAKSGAANNLVRFEIDDNTMSIYAKSALDDMFDALDVCQEGKPITIAFNVVYLNDLLKVFSSGNIVMKFVNGVSPCIVEYEEPIDAKDFFWLILPVRQ